MSLATATVRAERQEFRLTDDDFRTIASIVYDESGIVLKDHKKNMVYSRLARRLRELRLTSFGEYCALLQGGDGVAEMGVFINAITTNLTKFFRESHHFDHLAQQALPEALADAAHTGRRRLRIWSAGCSSGEEPYSIAMTLAEHFPQLSNWDARILATDLDTNMVARASAGQYTASSLDEMPVSLRNRYFATTSEDGRNVASDALRRLIAFKQLNLLRTWPMKGPFDVIFCRNVMIYFDSETKSGLVRRFAEMLKPNGFLYIGHSETLLDKQTDFSLCGRTIYRKSA